ncbi:MAG: hypothetical protein M3Y45_04405, partial [Actinomycetota bacterium]|nr:hypothetical protein [Actinomycetota bacterium]
ILTALLLVGAGLIFAGSYSSSSADATETAGSSARQTVILGANGPMPEARCPANCFGLAIVTGMQTKLDGIVNPYRVPFNGEITAWKLGLGKPNKAQRKFFQDRFGQRPQAGLAVLKKVRVDGKVRYLLRKRSPLQGLNRVLGTNASFKLDKPIKVAKGNFIALTIPTWAPALAMPAGLTNQGFNWRASRNRSTCRKTITRETSRPQQGVGSKREYGCRFDGEQLLYRVKIRSR